MRCEQWNQEKKTMAEHPYSVLCLLSSVWNVIEILRFGTTESEWKGKAVDEFKFQSPSRLYVNGRTRSNIIVLSEDGAISGTFVIDKVIHQSNLGEAIRVRIYLRRNVKRLERLRQVEILQVVIAQLKKVRVCGGRGGGRSDSIEKNAVVYAFITVAITTRNRIEILSFEANEVAFAMFIFLTMTYTETQRMHISPGKIG